ncbi:MAG: DUF222 domain-containing protein [Actinomycetota bacterium]
MDASALDPDEAAELVESFAEIERLATAGRTMAGRAIEKSRLWWQRGYRTPAQWMASRAQTTVGAAIATLETGRRLDELPATREAFTNGTLSSMQAAEIARAAAEAPDAEASLLDAARIETVAGLRERCREVIAAATKDGDADERIHRSRYVRHWLDADGAFRLDARLTADAGALLAARIDARSLELRDAGRRAGSKERREAFAADALVELARGAIAGPRAVVHVHVDEGAWTRGRLASGETCRVTGVGPVTVAAARRLATDGIVKTVLHDGADVRAVAHLGRTIPARLRTALEARDQTCVVPDCDEREGLEIDHVVPMAEGGPTSLDNLARLCHWHHSLKTHRGWRLEGGPGRWNWFGPKQAAGP